MYELKKALLSKKMLYCMLICLLLLLIGCMGQLRYSDVDFLEAYLFAMIANTVSVLALLFPFITSLPYALSYRDECNSGYWNYMIVKTKKKKLLALKYICNLIASFFVMWLPQIVFLIVLIGIKGVKLSENINVEILFYSEYAYKHPVLYVCFLTVVSSLCGMSLSAIAMGVSAIFHNRYVAFFSPFILELWSMVFFSVTIGYQYTIPSIYMPALDDTSLSLILTYNGVLLLIATIMFCIGVKINEEK